MNTIKKHTLLKYLPDELFSEEKVKTERVFEVNKVSIRQGDVVYLITREFRFYDNFALNFAIEKAKELNKNLRVIFKTETFKNEGKSKFFKSKFEKVKKDFKENKIPFEVVDSLNSSNLEGVGVLVKDFDVIENPFLPLDEFKIYEVDSKNIIPTRYISDKQEYNAASFRRKVYFSISCFLTQFPNNEKNREDLKIVADFIEEKLPYYDEFKNNPTKNVTSNFSKYLNFGFISAQRIALEVLKSDVSITNKESFLEELIVRKELSDNFCLYCKDFKSLNCVSDWAKITLKAHERDFRSDFFSCEELENAKTYDDLWNASQKQLVKEGKIEGYLRMYWAKQILQWTPDAKTALKIAVYLNDKYAYDAPSANGYVGILWSIGGLHDRAFADRPVSGKIRSMTYNGAKHKFDVEEYIKKYL